MILPSLIFGTTIRSSFSAFIFVEFFSKLPYLVPPWFPFSVEFYSMLWFVIMLVVSFFFVSLQLPLSRSSHALFSLH